MSVSIEAYSFKSVATTASTIVPIPCVLGGVLAASGTSPTIAIKDGGSSGTVVLGTMTLTAGTFVRIPAALSTSLYVEVGGTSPVVTVFYS